MDHSNQIRQFYRQTDACFLSYQEQAALRDALESAISRLHQEPTWLSGQAGGGPIGLLEQEFQRVTEMPYALVVSSCTAALHTCLLAAGISPGDEVIVPAYTWGGTLAGVLQQGAKPVFADVGLHSATLHPGAIMDCINSRTRAIILVHLYGHPAPGLDDIQQLAKAHELLLIEDCAQAFGARYRGRSVGSFGDAGCFSLGFGKTLIGGEGGVIVTKDAKLYDRLLFHTQHPLRQRRDGSGWQLDNEFGLNYRAHPLAAAMAYTLLCCPAFHQRQALRQQFCHQLHEALEEVATDTAGELVLPPVGSENQSAWHSFSLRYIPGPSSMDLTQLLTSLMDAGLPVTRGRPCQPLYQSRALGHYGWCLRGTVHCPNTELQCQQRLELSIPSFAPSISQGSLREAVDSILQVMCGTMVQ